MTHVAELASLLLTVYFVAQFVLVSKTAQMIAAQLERSALALLVATPLGVFLRRKSGPEWLVPFAQVRPVLYVLL